MTEACKYWRQSSTTWMKDFFKAERRELEFRDAAEFEARVAIKVAQLLRSEDRRLRYILDAAASASPINRGPETTFEWEVIKEARLAVEEEMDR